MEISDIDRNGIMMGKIYLPVAGGHGGRCVLLHSLSEYSSGAINLLTSEKYYCCRTVAVAGSLVERGLASVDSYAQRRGGAEIAVSTCTAAKSPT